MGSEPQRLEELLDAARAWIAVDPDPETRAELSGLIERGQHAEIADRFAASLEFGTAGLRGALGAGPNRMNRLVVRQAAAGLADYLGSGRTVVIGYDARHKSEVFAEDSARVLAAADVRAILLPRPLPTPVLAFAVRYFDADGGVMVTASHNPRSDNGYKVYLGDGAQIIPPSESLISERIRARSPASITLADGDDSRIERCGDDVVEAFLAMAAECRLTTEVDDLSVVYTAMHGVGRDCLLAAFARAGLAPPQVVAEQSEPDPSFPTLVFPNPEEPGALDLALRQAQDLNADLVLANDPDADRLGVAVPTPVGWRNLTGNEIGVLLADHILRHTEGEDRLVATTIVSSRLLGRMAKSTGVHYAETLTGFKWIVRPGLDGDHGRFVFGYEEALGYLVTDQVNDKDGITAALLFVELAGALARRGRTVLDRLGELARQHGLHATDTWSIRFSDPAGISGVMAQARRNPPSALGAQPVTAIVDHLAGINGRLPTDALEWQLGEQARIVLRPSGTEPKAKIYFEVVIPVVDDDIDAANVAAEAQLSALRSDLGTHLGLAAGGRMT